MTPKKHLTDVISNTRLPREFRTEDIQIVGDIVPEKVLKRIAKELLKEPDAS